MMKPFIKLVVVILCVITINTSAYEHYDEVLERGVLTSLEGMRALEVHYTNYLFYNINLGTPGFFEQGAYNTRVKKGDSYEIDYKPFVRWRAGPIRETGKNLDFYIDAGNRGFFTIQLPGMLGFTRDGRMHIDSQRRLVTLAGNFPVLGEEGPIVLPEGDEILVSRAGLIYVEGQAIQKMKVTVFKRLVEMQTLETLNGTVFVLTQPIETEEGPEHYAILQGHIEENNVIKGLTGDILLAKNAYDVSAKTAHLINRALNTAASLAAP
jgi:flagellar basal-body rod protein FlgF